MELRRPSPSRAGLSVVCVFLCVVSPLAPAGAQSKISRRNSTPARATGRLKVVTGQAGSVVFINGIRHGATNENGELDLPRVAAGSYPVRVRTVGHVDGKASVVVAAGVTRMLRVAQQPTYDEATVHYQKGDALRDRGKTRDAIEEYKQALAIRDWPEPRIAMARSLVTLQDFQEAEKQIQSAIKTGGHTLVEAQTVLANLRRNQGLVDESIAEYRKALRLARGNSFEAHIGLAIALSETVERDSSPRLIDEIAREYRIGIAQDMETEPILYYQLGEILEKSGRARDAIEAYRGYLRLDPEGEYASAAESIIERLKEENTIKQPGQTRTRR